MTTIISNGIMVEVLYKAAQSCHPPVRSVGRMGELPGKHAAQIRYGSFFIATEALRIQKMYKEINFVAYKRKI
jgi:hypothetical protein